MKFTKMQGAGNDFIVLEADGMSYDWPAVAVAMCDRHYGVGADGLLLLLPSAVADFRMRVFDCDGSEAEACGNGLRCLVKYFVDGKLTDAGSQEISVETMAGIRRARVQKAAGKVHTSMGKPEFAAKKIPVIPGGALDDIIPLSYALTVDARELQLKLVSIGNPHAVCFLTQPVSEFPLSQVGPEVENLSIFPSRVNFEVVRVLDRQQIEARVWERGVGETLACGSGACAIVVAARLLGYVDGKVKVKLPGGVLEVEWDGVGEVFLSGPAETVFTGEWPSTGSLEMA